MALQGVVQVMTLQGVQVHRKGCCYRARCIIVQFCGLSACHTCLH